MLSHFSHVQLFATPWTVALQAPLSMQFSRQKYWSGLPFHSPGDLPNPGIVPRFPELQEDFLPLIKWQPTPVFLTGEFHGQRSLAGYSAGGRKESDMTEAT